MSWLPVIVLAGLALALAVFVLRIPRGAITLLAATLLFGLAGYAWQGSPGMPAAPGIVAPSPPGLDELSVKSRREFYDASSLPSRFLITSDAFARRGDHIRAAAFANSAIRENPRDSEAWTALGNALVEHADGRLTPAALDAFRQGANAAPLDPAPQFFLGFALLREGSLERALLIWEQILQAAPENARWRPAMAERVERLRTVLMSRR